MWLPANECNLLLARRLPCAANVRSVLVNMTQQPAYDDAMFDFSRSDFDSAIAKLKAVLAAEPAHFDAQLALGMAFIAKAIMPRQLPKAIKPSNCDPRNNSSTPTFPCFT